MNAGNGQKSGPYVVTLTELQAAKLEQLLKEKGNWQARTIPHARFSFSGDGVQCTYYGKKGRLVIQGKKTEDFVRYILEPQITGEARYGYEQEWAKIENAEMFQPHAGLDESGKGDVFGPLVTACCYVREETAEQLLRAGIMDCKRIQSQQRLFELEDACRSILGREAISIVRLRNPSYNRFYARVRNVNVLLAWAHGKALENLRERIPECRDALLDKFTVNESMVARYFPPTQQCRLRQRVRAEEDIAVAAASICARAEFIRVLTEMEEHYSMAFPKGAGPAVATALADFVQRFGTAELEQVCKLHFRTVQRILNGDASPQDDEAPGTSESQ